MLSFRSFLGAALCTASLLSACAVDVADGEKAPFEAADLTSDDSAADAYTRKTNILGTLSTNSDSASGKFRDGEYTGYLFTGKRGANVTITLEGERGADPVLLVYGPQTASGWSRSRPIAENDDERRGVTRSKVRVRLPNDGTYLIVAAEYHGRAGKRFTLNFENSGGALFCSSSSCPTGSECVTPECGPSERCAQYCAPVDPTTACEVDADCTVIDTSCCCPREAAVNGDYASALSPECDPRGLCPAVVCREPAGSTAACVANKCELVAAPPPDAACTVGDDSTCEAGETCMPGLCRFSCPAGDVSCCAPNHCEAREPGSCRSDDDCPQPLCLPGGPCPHFSCVEGMCQRDEAPPSACVRGGCSGQLCLAAGAPGGITTCEFRPEYACYQAAACEQQADGACGFTMTPELQRCLEAATRPDCRTSGCGTGRSCQYCWGSFACVPEGALC